MGNYSFNNNPILLEKLREIADYLAKFDMVIGNLETPLSYRQKPWGAKSAYICADPANIEVLKLLHVDAVTLANNHMFDFGKEGFDTTVSELEKAGIEWFGANGKDFRVERDGNRIAFNGFCCYSTNPLKIASKFGKYGINGFDVSEATGILASNHADGWLNIFAVHSGIEHVNRPSIDQIRVSRQLADVAPYVWYGHHPHVVQGVDSYKGSVIAHSLGNFCFAGNTEDKNRPVIELSDNNRRGMILELEIEDNKVKSVKPTLIHIGEDGHIAILDDEQTMREYSGYIADALTSPEEYTALRKAQRGEYLKRRMEMRNLSWVLKRLRPRYARLMLDNRSNAKKYIRNVASQLKR